VGLLGASGETLDLAVGYLRIIIPSLPLLLVGMVGGAILRAHGAARLAMMATIWGGLVNAVLDPILIFGLNLELTGAALASVAARITIAAVALLPILRNYGGLARPEPRGLAADFRPVFALALPAILTQLATPVGQAFVTRSMAEFGEAAVAGMAIVARLTPVAFGVIFALSGAVGPIIGQNAGAGEGARVRRAYRDALLFTAVVVVPISLILFLLRGPIVALFDAEGVTVELVFLFCGPLALAFFFNGMLFVSNAAFNNLGHPFTSTLAELGPPYARDDPARDPVRGAFRRVGRADRSGGGGRGLRPSVAVAGAAGDETRGRRRTGRQFPAAGARHPASAPPALRPIRAA
jgi:Na+-driven multidrug efflux pump